MCVLLSLDGNTAFGCVPILCGKCVCVISKVISDVVRVNATFWRSFGNKGSDIAH